MHKQTNDNFMIYDINTNRTELIRELTGKNYYSKIKRGEEKMLRYLKDGEVYVLDTGNFDTVKIRTRFYRNGNSTIDLPREVFNALSLMFKHTSYGYLDTDVTLWYPDITSWYPDQRAYYPYHFSYSARKEREIKKVIFNGPATVVLWGDGTKTVVKCSKDDEFDPEKGLAMAIAKKFFGNENGYTKNIKKWVDTYEDKDADTNIDTGAIGVVGGSFADVMSTVVGDILRNIFEVHSPSKTFMGDMNKNIEKESKEGKE